MKKNLLDFFVKGIVSLGLVGYLLWRVKWDELLPLLRSLNGWLFAVAFVLYLGAITNSAFKWFVLLRALEIKIPFTELLSYSFVGVFFNNFLPANIGGDLMRGYGLARYTSRTADAAISVVVDRLVGLMAFMFTAVLAAAWIVLAGGREELRNVAVAAGASFSVVILLFALMLSRRIRASGRKLLQFRWTKVLLPLYDRLSAALDAYRFRYRTLSTAFWIAVGTMIITNFVNYLLAEAVQPGSIPLEYIFLFNPIIAFVLLIPISIGGLGLNQSAFVFFYGLVGVPEKIALAASLALQGVIYLSALPGGFLWWRWKKAVSRESAVLDRAKEEDIPF